MKILQFVFIFFAVSVQVRADILHTGSTVIEGATFGCIGLDGIPFASGSVLESKCCTNGSLNPSAAADTCRAGFGSIGGDATVAAYSFNQIALQTLSVAQDLNGVETDTSSSSPSESSPKP
jgi:hypothetical protein